MKVVLEGELTDAVIDALVRTSCPRDFGLDDNCGNGCTSCWENALKECEVK